MLEGEGKIRKMAHTLDPHDKKYRAPSFEELIEPAMHILSSSDPLQSRSNKPLQMQFDHQLKA